MPRPLYIRWLLLTGLIGPACAHVEPPPGGPEDRTSPAVLATNPESGVIVEPFDDAVRFQFDERISEQGIEEAVSVSPRTSPVQIGHGRADIRVTLREGWQAGHIYHVAVSRGVRDLFGNALSGAVTIVFSTGPEIPSTRISGAVTDRLTGSPVVDARVEAIRSADSLTYSTQSDSSGLFSMESFPTGDYQIRAFPDINDNRSLEAFESSDSSFVTVSLTDSADVTLRILARDSTSAVISSVEVDSLTVNVEFDDHLDAEQTVLPEQITLSTETTGPIVVDSIGFPAPAGAGAAAVRGPLPSRILILHLPAGTMLIPGAEYSITVRAVRNVNGIVGDTESTFEPPEPPTPPEPPPAP